MCSKGAKLGKNVETYRQLVSNEKSKRRGDSVSVFPKETAWVSEVAQ